MPHKQFKKFPKITNKFTKRYIIDIITVSEIIAILHVLKLQLFSGQ